MSKQKPKEELLETLIEGVRLLSLKVAEQDIRIERMDETRRLEAVFVIPFALIGFGLMSSGLHWLIGALVAGVPYIWFMMQRAKMVALAKHESWKIGLVANRDPRFNGVDRHEP